MRGDERWPMPRLSLFVIVLSSEERRTLEELALKYTAPYRDVIRARVILFAAAGWRNDHIAARLDMPPQHVSKWRKSFCQERLRGLLARARPPPPTAPRAGARGG